MLSFSAPTTIPRGVFSNLRKLRDNSRIFKLRMESMSSNLKATLPLNVEEDAELTDRFKGERSLAIYMCSVLTLYAPIDSALSITALFKHAQKSRKAAFAQGYSSCVSDLRDYIRSNGGFNLIFNFIFLLDSPYMPPSRA